MRKVLVLSLALVFSVSFAQDFVMGINFDAGGKFDGSFNEGTFNGFTKALEELSSEYDIEALEFEGSPDTFAQGLRNMASEGAELIVAPGFSQADAISTIAKEFPDTNIVSIDGWNPEPGPNELYVGFTEHEGSYLVGYIAGKLTQTGVVGFVGGMDIPLIQKFDLGYQEGVMKACADCTIISNYVGVTPSAWNDPAKAKELSTLQHGQGADIIFAAAGASGNGVIDFVKENMCYSHDDLGMDMRESPISAALSGMATSDDYAANCEGKQPLFAIGVDSNQNPFGDTDDNPETLNHVLTSMLKRVDVAAYNAVNAIVNDEFEGGYLTLDLAAEGVGYALDEYNSALIDDALQLELQLITDSIVSGEIVVTDYTAQ